jgi:DNA-binding FadR family transcriptional regulator
MFSYYAGRGAADDCGPEATLGRIGSVTAADAAATTARVRGPKLAAVVADRMIADIAGLGWPEGRVVGSEPQLLERYGVSRAVFREAVRLVEHKQVARMRRGPGGGLVVTRPSIDSVADAVSVYLVYIGAEIDEVFEARLAIEGAAAELAPDRLDDADVAALRALVAHEADGTVVDHRVLHNLIATVTGNPALAFFVDLLHRVTFLYLPLRSRGPISTRTLAESAAAHAAIVEAILAGDGLLARHRMARHLDAEADYIRRRRPSRQRLADLTEVVGRSDKRAEGLARRMFGEVTAAGWPVGTLLGSEAELIERYDVSRAVLREAVRVLEHHQVARMRRGPGGGLFVAEPGVEAVTDAVALHVDRLGILPEQLFEVRGAVELAVLDRVMADLDTAGVARIETALELERAAAATATAAVTTIPATGDHGHAAGGVAVVGSDVHEVLADVAGNRVLELLTMVLTRLTRLHLAVPTGTPDPPPAVVDVHQRIVAAIVSGDVELARRRMRRHLDALVPWVR